MEARRTLLGQLTRTINMMKSQDVMTIACEGPFIKLLEETRKYVSRGEPEKIEIEGGGSSWWYVCPECHGEIDNSDHYCRHCGQAVKWDA